MEDHGSGHALTEVALALAMAFFSIMVLAMVSMSVPHNNKVQQSASAKVKMPEQSMQLTPAQDDKETGEQSSAQVQFVFYFNHRFYDQELKLLNVAKIKQFSQVVLALPPELTVKQAMKVQQQINRSDMVITQFDRQWQQRLEKI